MDRTKGKRLVMLIALSVISITLLLTIFNPFVGREPPPIQYNKTPTVNEPIIPIDLIEKSEGKVIIDLYGDDLLELPLINATLNSYKPYREYLNFLVKYIPSSTYDYIVTFKDKSGEEIFISAFVKHGENVFTTFDLEAQTLYRLGHGIEILISELDSGENKVVAIHSTINNLSEYAYLLSMIMSSQNIDGTPNEINFLGWAIWTFNIRINRSIYVDGKQETLSNVILIIEQPVYDSSDIYWDIESEMLFWSLVARPAFGLAFNIAINDYIELKILYKEYGEYFAKLIRFPGLPDKPIEGLNGCFTPFRLKNILSSTECSMTAFSQGVFLVYALGYPIGIIDEKDMRVPSYPGAILLIPSTISHDIGNQFFTIDLNGDLLPERYIEIFETRYSLKDLYNTTRFQEFVVYLLNPDYPLYPYADKFKYARMIDIIGLSEYFKSLPSIFTPPWYGAVRTLFTGDPVYEIFFTTFGYRATEAGVTGPILREIYYKYYIDQDVFRLRPQKSIHSRIVSESQPPPSYQIIRDIEGSINVEWKCTSHCDIDEMLKDTPSFLPFRRQFYEFNYTKVHVQWDIVRKTRYFNESGFMGYIYRQIFHGIYRTWNLTIGITLTFDYPTLEASVYLNYRTNQTGENENYTSPQPLYSISLNPFLNDPSRPISVVPPIYLSTSLTVVKNGSIINHLLPDESNMFLNVKVPNMENNSEIEIEIYYDGVYDFIGKGIKKQESPYLTIIFSINFTYIHGDKIDDILLLITLMPPG